MCRMNKLLNLLAAAILLSTSAWAQQGCERPWPVEIPDNAASKDEMLAVQTRVKQYLKEGEAYLSCNDAAQQRLSPDAATSAQTLRIYIGLYNNTVDEMKVVGDKFNLLVRKYKKENG